MEIPYSVDELRAACFEAISVNGLRECVPPPDRVLRLRRARRPHGANPVDVVIMCWPWGAYLGEGSQEHGIRAMISSWQRVGPNTIPHAAKATGVYLNSMLATHEARRSGYDEAIMLTDNGFIADGPGETIFVVKDGNVFTPRSRALRSCPGSRVTRSSRSPRTSATPSSRSR